MEQKKKKLREKIMDERIFGSIVDKAFSDADLNKNGFIDKKELALVINQVREGIGLPKASEKEIQNELKRLDSNKDGKISKEEFRVLVYEITMFSIDQL